MSGTSPRRPAVLHRARRRSQCEAIGIWSGSGWRYRQDVSATVDPRPSRGLLSCDQAMGATYMLPLGIRCATDKRLSAAAEIGRQGILQVPEVIERVLSSRCAVIECGSTRLEIVAGENSGGSDYVESLVAGNRQSVADAVGSLVVLQRTCAADVSQRAVVGDRHVFDSRFRSGDRRSGWRRAVARARSATAYCGRDKRRRRRDVQGDLTSATARARWSCSRPASRPRPSSSRSGPRIRSAAGRLEQGRPSVCRDEPEGRYAVH